MTSSFSPALTGSSLLVHFLLVSVGTTVTCCNTCISPSYWKTWKTTPSVSSLSLELYTVLWPCSELRMKWIKLPAALCNLKPAYRCVTNLIWKDKCSEIINKEIRGRQTLNFFLNSFSSFSIFFCFFGSISSALVLPLKFGRLAYKTIKSFTEWKTRAANLDPNNQRIFTLTAPAEGRKGRRTLRVNVVVYLLISGCCWLIWEKSSRGNNQQWCLTQHACKSY